MNGMAENLREAWAALAMIRESIETFAPPGSVKASEYLDGPTFMHEAEALVAGIVALANMDIGPSIDPNIAAVIFPELQCPRDLMWQIAHGYLGRI